MVVVLLALWFVYWFAAIGLISLRLVTYVSLLFHIHHDLYVGSPEYRAVFMVVVSVVIKSGTRHFLGNYWPVTGSSEYRRNILAYLGQRTLTFGLDILCLRELHERDLLKCMLSGVSLALSVPPVVDCSSSASAAASSCSPITDESGSEVDD